MNNQKENNKESNEINNNVNEEEKKDKNDKKDKKQHEYPIINHLRLNKSYKTFNKPEFLKSPKNPEKVSLRLPYMRLTQSKVNNLKINNLLNLEPFFTNFNNNMEKKGRDIIREIASEYKDEKYELNKVVFRYGDEADRYFIINEGEVSLYFPFTETVDMNIDEYFIYILRLRRYNEIEMLNDVLLLNKGEFMKDFDEGFYIDNYIYKLYTTYLKLKFDPTFLYHQEKKKKAKKKNNDDLVVDDTIKIKNHKMTKNKSTSNHYKRKINFNMDDNDVDINIFDNFSERSIKELLLRIGDELIETMKWIMPEKIYNIIEEKDEYIVTKKVMKIPQKLIKKYKEFDPNDINENDYYKRILPVKRPNDNLISKKIIIMKYLYINTLKNGQSFGDFNSDSLSLFSHKYIDIAKKSLLSLHLHKFHHFRNMTAISTKKMKNYNKLHLYSFNKKIYSKYFSIYIDKITCDKKRFLLNNGLFRDTNNKNLIRTYSVCFKEKKIREGEHIIYEKDKLIESEIYVYFIINGEFQSNCTKSISQIDEIIKILGHEENIKETYSKSIKNIVNTPFYDELVKKPMNFKLNYLTKNDIVGITEIYKDDEYFNNIVCTGNNTKIYKVDARIVKLLVDSDPIINDNKNIIIYNKYQMLCDILLKQRKMFFDSYINIDSFNNFNTLNDNTSNKNNNDNNSDNNDDIIINNNSNNKYIYKSLPKRNTIMTSFDYKYSPISKIFKASPKNINTIKNNTNRNKYKSRNNINKEKKTQDIDQILVGLSRIFTLSEKRKENNLKFRKKYEKKMEILEKMKKLRQLRQKEIIPENLGIRGRNENTSFCNFQKSNTIYGEIYKFLPSLNKNENKNIGTEYELVLPYENPLLVRSMSTSEINPLFYDDFNRSFNTSQYFNINYNDENSGSRSIDNKKDKLEYTLKFRSDIKLIKKPNKFIKNDIVTQKLRNIYKGKFEKMLFDNNKKSI